MTGKAILHYRIPIYGNAAIVIDIDASELLTDVDGIIQRAEHLAPFYAAVANIARARFRQNFKDAGPGWQALAPSTVAAKQALNLPGQLRTPKRGIFPPRLKQQGGYGAAEILIRGGKMRDALGVRGAPGNITEISDDGAVLGIDPSVVPYAAVHEFGGRGTYPITPRFAKALAFMGSQGQMLYRRRVMHPPLPARPMTNLTADDLDAMADAGLDYLLSGTVPPAGSD